MQENSVRDCGAERSRSHNFSVLWGVNTGACSTFVLEYMEMSQQSRSSPESPWGWG